MKIKKSSIDREIVIIAGTDDVYISAKFLADNLYFIVMKNLAKQMPTILGKLSIMAKRMVTGDKTWRNLFDEIIGSVITTTVEEIAKNPKAMWKYWRKK